MNGDESQPSTSTTSELLAHLSCSLCNGTLHNTLVLTSCMHRFCKACIEGYWLSHKGRAGCPEAGCGKAVVGQGGCRTDPMCDALVAELLKVGADGRRGGDVEMLDGGLAAFPSTSGGACDGAASDGAACDGVACDGGRQSSGGSLRRFDEYFRGAPQSALEVAMRAGGGIQPWERECLASLRPLYSLFLLRDGRVGGEKRMGKSEIGRLPFQHVAVPRHKTAGDVRRALAAYNAQAGSGRVSMLVEWANPAGGEAPCRHLIEDESVAFEDLLRSLDVDDSTRVLTIRLETRG